MYYSLRQNQPTRSSRLLSVSNNIIRSTAAYDDTTGRPIMYTFYELKYTGAVDSHGDQALLDLWKNAWNEAGFDARILTMDDAKHHPRYNEFEEKLNQIPINLNKQYNRLCFIRWLAVAAVGGGWMSDMDVLPMNFHQPEEYFQDGRFAIYSAAPAGGIPCLMSGSQSEWERLAFAIVENGIDHRNEYTWTDMFASVDLYKTNPESSYELLDLMGALKKVDWSSSNEREEACKEYSEKLAMHFAHSAVHKVGLRNINSRPEFAADWMNEWKVSCEGGLLGMDQNS